MWGRYSLRTVVIAGAAIAALVLSVLPPAYMVWQALGASVGDRAFALDARQRGLLVTTALMGILTTASATATARRCGWHRRGRGVAAAG